MFENVTLHTLKINGLVKKKAKYFITFNAVIHKIVFFLCVLFLVYRTELYSVCWFYILQYYWIYWFSYDFGGDFIYIYMLYIYNLGLNTYIIMSSANKDISTSSFPVPMPLISFACLIALAKISSTVLHRSAGSGHIYLAPGFRKKLSKLSLLRMMLAMGLSYMSFTFWGVCPLYPIRWVFLSWKDTVLCQVLFLHLSRWSWFHLSFC